LIKYIKSVFRRVAKSLSYIEEARCLNVKGKWGKGKSKLKTNLQYEIANKTDHSCVPKLTGIEVKINWITAGKGLRKTCLFLYMQFIRKNSHLRQRV